MSAKKTPKRKITKKRKPPRKSASAKHSAPISGALAKKVKEFEKKSGRLIAKGRERGFVTYDEILREFPTIENDVSYLDDLYQKFSTAGIDVLEGGGMLEVAAEDRKSVV